MRLLHYNLRKAVKFTRGNCRTIVGGQRAMDWPETGGRGSGHKWAAGIPGLQRPRFGPSLTVSPLFFMVPMEGVEAARGVCVNVRECAL
jgi:hypothetical protein